MKKYTILALSLALCAAFFTGCGCTNRNGGRVTEPAVAPTTHATTMPTTAATTPATTPTTHATTVPTETTHAPTDNHATDNTVESNATENTQAEENARARRAPSMG